MISPQMKILLEKFDRGDRSALAKLITAVENGTPNSDEILSHVFPRVGKAHRVGITGPPGAGKSTIVDGLAVLMKRRGIEVSIIAVDPTSPFTGGALLGDRCRMDNASKEGIFIRSLATRGSLGGLSEATVWVADLMDAFGSEVILIETIGVGQTELDIMDASDTVVVILVPESGDAIQAMKAGLMEIADIFVINKFDREGALRFENELKGVFHLWKQNREWQPPVLRSIAIKGEGIGELYKKIEEHRRYLKESGLFERKRRERIRSEILKILKEKLLEKFYSKIELERKIDTLLEDVLRGKETPHSVVKKLLSG
jgi:LAO/AO transport system kinase